MTNAGLNVLHLATEATHLLLKSVNLARDRGTALVPGFLACSTVTRHRITVNWGARAAIRRPSGALADEGFSNQRTAVYRGPSEIARIRPIAIRMDVGPFGSFRCVCRDRRWLVLLPVA